MPGTPAQRLMSILCLPPHLARVSVGFRRAVWSRACAGMPPWCQPLPFYKVAMLIH